MITAILQDYKTLNVLEVTSISIKTIIKLKENSFFPEFKDFKDDLFIIKSKHFNHDEKSIVLKVKLNKLSKSFFRNTHYGYKNSNPYSFLRKIESRIDQILEENKYKTHVHSIVKQGVPKIAKKFGEEAVELVIEAGKTNDTDFKNEAADVLYYYLILLHDRGYNLGEILDQLKSQKRKN